MKEALDERKKHVSAEEQAEIDEAEHRSFFPANIPEHADGECRASCADVQADVQGAERCCAETFPTLPSGQPPALAACSLSACSLLKQGRKRKGTKKKLSALGAAWG